MTTCSLLSPIAFPSEKIESPNLQKNETCRYSFQPFQTIQTMTSRFQGAFSSDPVKAFGKHVPHSQSFPKNVEPVFQTRQVELRKNSKQLHIYNNETFTIKQIKHTEKEILVEDEGRERTVPISEFTKIFNVAFCITCHRAQGATFDEPYSIHEFNQFDERLKYVALSRATDINLINII